MYPLKAGWQELPEFELKYNTQDDEQHLQQQQAVTFIHEDDHNAELQNLVNRWMPKKVFILVCKITHFQIFQYEILFFGFF